MWTCNDDDEEKAEEEEEKDENCDRERKKNSSIRNDKRWTNLNLSRIFIPKRKKNPIFFILHRKQLRLKTPLLNEISKSRAKEEQGTQKKSAQSKFRFQIYMPRILVEFSLGSVHCTFCLRFSSLLSRE